MLRVDAKRFSIGGAVVAAIAASSCCIGPIILVALGIGGAGAVASLAAYRPYLLAMTAALLAVGFYLTYRAPRLAKADACGCDRPKTNRVGRAGLWIATVVVVAFGAAPQVMAYLADAGTKPIVSAGGEGIAQAVLVVRGIDCEACAAPIRKKLAQVGGFLDVRLDVSAQTITVTYEAALGRLNAYVAALNELGYEASIPADEKTRQK